MTTASVEVDMDALSLADCVPAVSMVTTSTQTDDCALDDDDDVDYIDQLDHYAPSGSFYDHL